MANKFIVAVAAITLSGIGALVAQEKSAGEVEKLQAEIAEARKAAAANPIVKDAMSPPVLAYLAQQKRRRLLILASLRQR